MSRQDNDALPTLSTVLDELLHHIATALAALRAHKASDERIHQARKQLKRARANLRLLRDAIGKRAYARENAALRDAARPLSGVRDAMVLIQTLDRLIGALRNGPRKALQSAPCA